MKGEFDTKDHLVKATAEDVRVFAAVTTDLVRDGVKRHDCYPVAAAALGRTMTGALLFAANLKNKEAVTIKINGGGALGSIVADAVPEGFVRGYVTNPHVDLPAKSPTESNPHGKIDVAGGVGRNGLVTVTRFTGLKEPITGSAEIVSGEIAEDLTNYLATSEQTPSSVGLGVLVGTDLDIISAGGFLIQPLPNASDSSITKLENNLKTIDPVSTMIENGLDAEGIIRELLKGFDQINILSTTDLAFRCHCSKRRIEDTLMTLTEKDLNNLVEDGKAEVVCQFCGKKYQFSKEELVALRNVGLGKVHL